jgi:segregation and condensation protein B
MNESHIRNVIEAALLAAGKPLQPAELVQLFDESARPEMLEIHTALEALTAEYSSRGIEIKETAAGFRIQVRREMANEISRLWPERPARYSRALLETLALVAYRQPITRAEIEAVRGVAVNPNIIKTVIERNWVRVVGHRDVPGRPELLGTTREFLDYFGLKNLDELPPLAELKTLGDIKVQFDLPDPGPVDLVAGATPEGASAPEAASTAQSDGIPEAVVGGGVDTLSEGTLTPEEAMALVGASTPEGSSTPESISTPDSSTSTPDGVTAAGSMSSESASAEAEEFAASIDAELAAGDDELADDGSEDDELSAAGPTSGELVAGPRNMDE